jgi:type VI secretion system protein ImpG
VEVIVFLNRSIQRVEQAVDAQTFRLGCTPVINLFEQAAEPLALTPARYQYRLVPDIGHPQGLEVYAVEAVTSTEPTSNVVTTYEPFYSIRHVRAPDGDQTFWYTSRRPATAPDDRGTEVYLNLVDLGFSPLLPTAATLDVRTVCTNRDLPALFQQRGEAPVFELQGAAPLARIVCLRPPTTPLRPPRRRGVDWRLVSHLNLNFLSLAGPGEGLEAFKEILRLYDFSDPEAGQQQLATINRQLIDGIEALTARRVVGRTEAGTASGFCRGIEVTLAFDEQKYAGTGAFLFASVLERFLGLYTSINSFTQLVGKTKKGARPFKHWPPRVGDVPLI